MPKPTTFKMKYLADILSNIDNLYYNQKALSMGEYVNACLLLKVIETMHDFMFIVQGEGLEGEPVK